MRSAYVALANERAARVRVGEERGHGRMNYKRPNPMNPAHVPTPLRSFYEHILTNIYSCLHTPSIHLAGYEHGGYAIMHT